MNKIFLVISVLVIVSFVVIYTDTEEHKAFVDVDVKLCDYYLNGLDLSLELCLHNPRSINAKLDRADIYIYAGNNKIAEATTHDITIPAKSRIEVDVDITIIKVGIFSSLFDKLVGNDTPIMVSGRVYYYTPFGGTITIPFKEEIKL